jgi:methyl-accepting chemotaxis protein
VRDLNDQGLLAGVALTYAQYKATKNVYHIISKGTLENVLAERVDKPLGDIETELNDLSTFVYDDVNTDIANLRNDVADINSAIGDIDSALDELHNYAQAIIGGAE